MLRLAFLMCFMLACLSVGVQARDGRYVDYPGYTYCWVSWVTPEGELTAGFVETQSYGSCAVIKSHIYRARQGVHTTVAWCFDTGRRVAVGEWW